MSPGGTWSSSNTAVATIGTDGIAYGHTTGTTELTYSIGDCQTHKEIRVLSVGRFSNTTGLNNLNGATQLQVFPNPTQDNITISYPCNSAGELQIKISNTTGQVVYTETVNCTENNTVQHTIDLSNFSPGVYFVDLLLNDQHVVKKVVKM